MALELLRERIQELRLALDRELPDIAATAAMDLKGLAELEIQEKGFGAVYSPNPVKNQTLRKNILNNKGRDFLAKRDSTGFGATTYKEFRQAQGLQTAHVDLTYTGKMFAGMRVISRTNRNGLYTAILGHNDKSGALKMDANFKRYGDFIAKVIDRQDLQAISETVNTKVLEIIVNVFEK